jgi:hypothetical protein
VIITFADGAKRKFPVIENVYRAAGNGMTAMTLKTANGS